MKKQQEQQQEEPRNPPLLLLLTRTRRTPASLSAGNASYRAPFTFISFIILPLLILIVVAFVCGYFVALGIRQHVPQRGPGGSVDFSPTRPPRPTVDSHALSQSVRAIVVRIGPNRTGRARLRRTIGDRNRLDRGVLYRAMVGTNIRPTLDLTWILCRNDNQTSAVQSNFWGTSGSRSFVGGSRRPRTTRTTPLHMPWAPRIVDQTRFTVIATIVILAALVDEVVLARWFVSIFECL